MSTSSLSIIRLGQVRNTGPKYSGTFCNVKNHGLTCRITPGVYKCQTDNLRTKRRPCLFLPFVQFLHSSKPITQILPPLLGSSLEVLKLIMSVENERQQLSEPAFDAFNLFLCSKKKKRVCMLFNWEDSPFLEPRLLSSSKIALLSPQLFCTKAYLFYFSCSYNSMFYIDNGRKERQP